MNEMPPHGHGLRHQQGNPRYPNHRGQGRSNGRSEKEKLLLRLRKVEGQVRGLQRMVDEDRYCVDILDQVAAVRAALGRIALNLLADHTRGCVSGAIHSGQGQDAVSELIEVVDRLADRQDGSLPLPVAADDRPWPAANDRGGTMMEKVTLTIQGMSCGHCVMAVSKALKGLTGVADAQVEIGSAVVTYDPGQVGLEKIKEAVSEEGYEVVGASA